MQSNVQQQDGLYLGYMGIIVYTVQDLRGSEALRMSNNKMDYWDYSEEMSDKTTKEEQSGQV